MESKEKRSAKAFSGGMVALGLFLLPLPIRVFRIIFNAYNISSVLYSLQTLLSDLGLFFVVVAFIFIKSKKSVSVITAWSAAFCNLVSFVLNLIRVFSGYSGLIYPAAYVGPLVCSILLVVYCLSPNFKRCYLFSIITALLTLIWWILSCFYPEGDFLRYTECAIYLVGYLSNTDCAEKLHLHTHSKKETQNLTSALDSLEKFAKLKEQGILTDEEFEAKKQELMSPM